MNIPGQQASWLPIDWKDLELQIIRKVMGMRNQGIPMTRDKLCNRADITYDAILLATRRNTMRIKTINKLKKIGINVKILT